MTNYREDEMSEQELRVSGWGEGLLGYPSKALGTCDDSDDPHPKDQFAGGIFRKPCVNWTAV